MGPWYSFTTSSNFMMIIVNRQTSDGLRLKYRFRPVHNKNKNKEALDQKCDMKKMPVNNDDERRCEEVAQLLLEGKKGEDLAKAIRDLDRARSMEKEQLREQGDFEQEDLAMPMSMNMPAPMQTPISSNPQPQSNSYMGKFGNRRV
ncbi:hypothetical protein CPC08DRAFT_755392 [Agrocybe pediades]|nr:hypothetical protein CPC08DRAFT_755392 [Agrocybe pediades]